jgi:HEAT repeat protein
MNFIIALVLATQAGLVEDKEECKLTLDAFHVAYRSGTEGARIAAVELLAKHKCPNSIVALAPVLGADSDKVRIAAAKAIGSIDHPKALELLTAALPASETVKDVFEAVVKALQTLDWEAGAEPLNSLLTKYHEKGMTEELRIVIQALGSIGAPSSVDPLLQLLEHAENEGRAGRVGKLRSSGNQKLVVLEAPIKAALQAITGGNEPTYAKWKDWWRGNRERLLESAVLVYRCKLTGKRWEQKAGQAEVCPNHDKPEKDGQIVKTRLHARA